MEFVALREPTAEPPRAPQHQLQKDEVWQIVDVQKILAHSSGLSDLLSSLPWDYSGMGEGGLGLAPVANPDMLLLLISPPPSM